MSKLKGILFDMDGTITLTEPLHYAAFSKVLEKFGFVYSLETHVRRFAGAGSKLTFEKLFEEAGKPLDKKTLDDLMEAKKNLYTKIVQETDIPLVPGVAEFVKKVHERGLKKIIATGNGNLDDVRFILKKVGLLEYFPLIVSIKEVPRGKPFPDVFIEAAKRIECEPAETIVLEDSLNGVMAAAAANIRCIALETTTAREELLKAGADVVVKTYDEITEDMLGIS